MMNHTSLIEEFDAKSRQVEEELRAALDRIAEGRAPSENASQSLADAMGALRKTYSEIRSAAQRLKPETPDDQPVSEYEGILNEFAANALKEQIEHITDVLNRFILVSSDNAEYSDALLPYQQEAKKTLDELRSSELGTDAKLQTDYSEQDAFLRAITIEDIGTPEGEELLDVLESAYSRKVVRGVYLGKYFTAEQGDLPTRQTTEDGLVSAEEPGEKDNGADSTTNENAEGDTDKEVTAIDEEPSPIDAAQTIPPNRNEDTGSSEATAAASKAEGETEILCATNQIKSDNKVNASSFKNDLKKLPPTARDVLPVLSRCGALSEALLMSMIEFVIGGQDEEYASEVERTIDMLQKKSIIATFNTGDSSPVHALTTFGRSSIEKDSIKKLKLRGTNEPFWSSPICEHEFVANATVDKPSLMAVLKQNEALFAYLETVRCKRDADALSKLFSEIQRTDGAFVVPVQWGYSDYVCVLDPNPDSALTIDCDTLIVALDGKRPAIDDNSNNVFLAVDNNLYKWNGSWIEEGASAPDIASGREASEVAAHEDDETAEEVSEPNPRSEDGSRDNASPGIADNEDEPAAERSDSISDTSSNTAIEDSSVIAGRQTPNPLQEQFKTLVEDARQPSDQEFVSLVRGLLEGDQQPIDPEDEFSNLAAALALSKAASSIEGNEDCKHLLKQLVLATNVSIDSLDNSGSVITRAFPTFTEENEALVFSAYCFALFAPHRSYDYELNNAVDTFLEQFEDVFPSLAAFKPLMNELNSIFAVSPREGLSDNVLDMMGNQAKRNKRLSEMRNEAEKLLEPPKVKAKLHGVPELLTACFGKDSDLQYCMGIVESNNRDDAEFVKSVLEDYYDKDDSGSRIDYSKIDRKIDDEWRTATEGKSTSRLRKLGSEPRKKTVDGFKARLDLMEKWLSYDEGIVDQDTLSKIKSIKDTLTQTIEEILDSGALEASGKGSLVLKWLLKSLGDRLRDDEHVAPLFGSLLKTGYISLSDDMLPIIDESLNGVRYFEPWRNVLRHASAKPCNLHEMRERIFNDEDAVFDNLNQLKRINAILADEAPEYAVTDELVESAEAAAENQTEKFQDNLEIAYAYGQINEIQKENLAHILDSYQESFFALGDFGNWKQLIAALQRQIEDMSEPQGKALEIRLASHRGSLKRGTQASLLDEAERLLTEEKNYTVVEDYLNRYESGQKELTDELSFKMHDPDLFAEFISDEMFRPLYDACVKSKDQTFATFAKDFARSRYPSDWSNRQKESCEDLIKAWPVSSKRGNGQTLPKLLRKIGINTRGDAEQVKNEKRELYKVEVKPEQPDRTDYRHPIASFGTQAKSPLSVLVLYGNHTAQEIIDVVANENIVGMALVLIDYPISLQTRRQMAEIFHTTKSKLTSFLLIDRVLALHLALHQETERLPLMLKCTLPFTYYQPFVRDGGPTADEMFCGRERELRTIVDPNGASVVYGGRQLGKTALLERAKSLCMKPDNGEYAIYANIINCENEEDVSRALSNAICKAGLDLSEQISLGNLCKAIDSTMNESGISRLLLLIDEADRFLSGICDDGYSALQPLVDLKRETKNNFKFVLAGLHNVSRAKNATSRNGVFGQLGEPLCVKPLMPNEALQLISGPLGYLGFQVDRYPHLETILTSTNYYPGILQFFGYTLVETMKNQYGDYYRAADGNPPYTLHKEQLGSIMNSTDLNNSIKEKFRWSLELDPRYFMIARCIALMYYDQEATPGAEGIQKGFSVKEIKEWSDTFEITCLSHETAQSYEALLEEMKDMGILVKPDEEAARFRFRRNSFLNIIGSDEDSVFKDIEMNNV